MAAIADSSSSTCPFCNASISSTEIERHVNDHLEDETLARDLEFAHQLACAPESPSSNLVDSEVHAGDTLYRDLELARQLSCAPESPFPNVVDNHVDGDVLHRNSSGNNIESSPPRYGRASRDGAHQLDESTHCLTNSQTRSKFYEVKGGLMALLRNQLELESESIATTSILSGYVDHFQSTQSEDKGWGCGWRNIQMLSSHLLMQRPEAVKVIFGGTGFVPDISSLQRWLELAWERGFDTTGSEQFNNKIYGTKKWIGTTECAALLRSFGLRARVVDFCPKELESLMLSVDGAQGTNTCKRGKRKGIQISGPMDKFLVRNAHDPYQTSTANERKSSCSSILPQNNFTRRDNPEKPKIKGYEALVEWIWNYFYDGSSMESSKRVIVTDKAPLYFQHAGHSRTIIGIQAKNQNNGKRQYTLLILDPGHRTETLERSLKQKDGWQKLIKRGIHTLKKPQYQLLHVDSGIARGEEAERLKIMNSVLFHI